MTPLTSHRPAAKASATHAPNYIGMILYIVVVGYVLSEAGEGGGRQKRKGRRERKEGELLKCKLHLSANLLDPQLDVSLHEQFLP